MDWVHLAQYSPVLELVKAVINLRVPQKAANLFTNLKEGSAPWRQVVRQKDLRDCRLTSTEINEAN